MGSIPCPGWGTKILHAVQRGQKTQLLEPALGISGKGTEAEGSLFPGIKEMGDTGRISWPGAAQGPVG